MTITDWLALTDAELGLELAKVLAPGPWKHDCDLCHCEAGCKCNKCGVIYWRNGKPVSGPCPVPDPITIDWNTAMEWRDEAVRTHFVNAMYEISKACVGGMEIEMVSGKLFAFADWALCFAQPKHYLIAAALAQEAAK